MKTFTLEEKKGLAALQFLIGKFGLGQLGIGASVCAVKAAMPGLLAVGVLAAGGIGYFGAPALERLISPASVSRKAVPEDPFASENASPERERREFPQHRNGPPPSSLQIYSEGIVPYSAGTIPAGGAEIGQEAQEPENAEDVSAAGGGRAEKLEFKGGLGSGDRIMGAGGFTSSKAHFRGALPGSQPTGYRGGALGAIKKGGGGRVVGGSRWAMARGKGNMGTLKAAAKTSMLAARMSIPEAANRTAYDALTQTAGSGNVEEIGKGLQSQGGGGLEEGSGSKVSVSVKKIEPVNSGAAVADPRPWEKDYKTAKMLQMTAIALLIAASLAALAGYAARSSVYLAASSEFWFNLARVLARLAALAAIMLVAIGIKLNKYDEINANLFIVVGGILTVTAALVAWNPSAVGGLASKVGVSAANAATALNWVLGASAVAAGGWLSSQLK